ncbi:MAG TPA: translation initiation factor IF-2 subunit gamma [Candidatus Caldiarchaeum subterraneum]|uniref:protein-synthesizing GTPase n=1 Tax=Caldiarchaeum subterraneum TaxID=311458 RepID=A0A832ZU90_CALS0|nr:translation initiation factor IF-2 subunit gamma [Candidatus Caldarchaeum subterraneum]
MSKPLPRQPEINIGTLGHVDNGKSTLVQAISGVWTGRHSEELKRGITIRIGYADAAIYRCPMCEEPFNYMTHGRCPVHGVETEFVRAVSFVDCPGHHSLMITMLSGAALFDGAVFVLDARQRFPQPQDSEHLQAAAILGIRNIVFVQNKIDLVDRRRALENYEEVVRYVKSLGYEDPVVVPVSSQHGIGVEPLLYAMERYIPTPERGVAQPYRMPIIRSFDVNTPGKPAREIAGAVIGGSIIQGILKRGDEIEIAPGVAKPGQQKPGYEPLFTEAVSIMAGGRRVEDASPGGLTGVETTLDPSLGKSDGLVGNMAGKPGTLPPTWTRLRIEYILFQRVLGVQDEIIVKPIMEKEPLVINVYSAVTSGIVTRKTSEYIELELTRPVCAEIGRRVTLSRKIGAGWRLIGYGTIVS